eukprot:4854826-Pyramimonas_sp.AAC.1
MGTMRRSSQGLCQGAWRSWGVARHSYQQRITALFQQDINRWAAHMLEQQARLRRIRFDTF